MPICDMRCMQFCASAANLSTRMHLTPFDARVGGGTPPQLWVHRTTLPRGEGHRESWSRWGRKVGSGVCGRRPRPLKPGRVGSDSPAAVLLLSHHSESSSVSIRQHPCSTFLHKSLSAKTDSLPINRVQLRSCEKVFLGSETQPASPTPLVSTRTICVSSERLHCRAACEQQ